MDQRQISVCAVADLAPHPRNARKHSRAQIRAIAKSIEAFGFNAPILVDRNRQILAGQNTSSSLAFCKISSAQASRPSLDRCYRILAGRASD